MITNVGKDIATVILRWESVNPGLKRCKCSQKCDFGHNYRCEVDRKELQGLVSQIVSVSVIVSGGRVGFKRRVIGGAGGY